MIDHDGFFDWLIKALLAAAFGSWAWVVRHFGMQHVDSMKKLADVIEKMGERLSDVEKDVAHLKGRCERIHEE